MKRAIITRTEKPTPSPPVVGIDVGKDNLDVNVGPDLEEFRVANDAKGIREMLRRIEAHRPRIVVLESTGGYEQSAVGTLIARGQAVAMVNPRRISDFRKSMDRRAKTDRSDAYVIAVFAEKMDVRHTSMRKAFPATVLEVSRRRRQLVRQRSSEKVRVDKTLGPIAKASIVRSITFLDREIGKLEEQLRSLLETKERITDDGSRPDAKSRADVEKEPDPDGSIEFRRNVALVDTVPGIALVTAATLVAEMPEAGAMNRGTCASLLGVAPHPQQSGRRDGPRFISGGRRGLRNAFYMATLVATRLNPVIAAHYQALLARGKAKKVAIVACMRKLMTMINAMLKHGLRWDELDAVKSLQNSALGV